MLPNFEDMDEQAAYDMLTTGSELLRMLRDGDPESEDARASVLYYNLVES